MVALMQLPKMTVSFRSILALCAVLLLALPVLGQPTGDPRVREAQTLLTEQNFSPGPVDGILGPRTLSAILRFQIDRGLSPTRELDEITFEALRSAGTPRQGDAPAREAVVSSAQPRETATPTELQEAEATSRARVEDADDARTDVQPRETEVPPEQARRVPESGQAIAVTRPLSEARRPAEHTLAQAEEVSTVESRELAQEVRPETASGPGEEASETLSSRLPFEFNMENALFIGLLVFAGMAVLAAVYTSIRGRESKQAESPDHLAADEPTILASLSDRDPEATIISPVQATVTLPPEATVTAPTEATMRSVTEREQSSRTEPPPPEEVTQAVRSELFPELELGPGRGTFELKAPLFNEPPQEDPLADLNVHLAFERFDQAEALVKDAIERYPQRHEYILRLLEVYTAARNPVAFELYAKALREAVGAHSPLMAAALRWWDTISPEQPLFKEPLEEEVRGT